MTTENHPKQEISEDEYNNLPPIMKFNYQKVYTPAPRATDMNFEYTPIPTLYKLNINHQFKKA